MVAVKTGMIAPPFDATEHDATPYAAIVPPMGRQG